MNQPMTLQARRAMQPKERIHVMHRFTKTAPDLPTGAARVVHQALQVAEVSDGAAVAFVTCAELARAMCITERQVQRYAQKLRALDLPWFGMTVGRRGYCFTVIPTPDSKRQLPTSDTQSPTVNDIGVDQSPTLNDVGRQTPTVNDIPDPTVNDIGDETPISQEHPHTSPLRGECVGASDLTDTHPPGHALLLEAFEAFGIEPPNLFILEETASKVHGGVPEDLRRAYIGDTLNAWRREGRREDLAPSMLRDRISWWLGDREQADANAEKARQRGEVTDASSKPKVSPLDLGFDEPDTPPSDKPRVKSLAERLKPIEQKIQHGAQRRWERTRRAIRKARGMELEAGWEHVQAEHAKDLEDIRVYRESYGRVS